MNSTRLGCAALFGLACVALGCGDDGGGNDAGTGTESTTATTSGTTSESTSGTSNGTSDTSSTSASTSAGSTTEATGGGSSGGETTGGAIECPYTEVAGTPSVDFQLVANGFNRPVLAVGHPTERDRLFVVEQAGRVKLLDAGDTTAPAESFLEVSVAAGSATVVGFEVGLLGFALHPDYPEDPRVYIAYNPDSGGSPPTVIDEYTESGGTATFTRTIISADQPEGNHNGGMIQFGPDGYLYIGLGDGGGGEDQYDTGRNPGQILAKILRIGVEPDDAPDNVVACDACATLGPFDYTIPADNPFVGDGNFAPEIFAWGFRNPWRFSFDYETGRLYVSDVGQYDLEEVSVVEPGSDHGWSNMEGLSCFGGADCDAAAAAGDVNTDGQTMPLLDYTHSQGRCSITGLGIYRSCEVPAFDGVYFYADYCNGQVFGVHYDGTSITPLDEVFDFSGELPLGGGYNAYGDVYLTTAVAPGGPSTVFTDGNVYRLTAQ